MIKHVGYLHRVSVELFCFGLAEWGNSRLNRVWGQKYLQFSGFVVKTQESLSSAIHSDLSQSILHVACPTSNAILFYGINDTCIHQQCGYDMAMINYIASKLRVKLM